MTGEAKMVEYLREGLEALEFDGEQEIARVASFEDEGVLTSNEGLVVRLADGREFQVTVVQSKGRTWEDEDEEED